MRTDYELIQNDNIQGLLQKHDRYLKHHAKSIARKYDDYEDIKQDLVVEVLNLVKWVDKEKINDNFDMKFYIFQKCNAYRKSKKNRHRMIAKNFISLNKGDDSEEEYTNPNTLSGLRDNKTNIEKTFFLHNDFPLNVLSNNLDRNIYELYFIQNQKKKTIQEDLGIRYELLITRIKHIKTLYQKYN